MIIHAISFTSDVKTYTIANLYNYKCLYKTHPVFSKMFHRLSRGSPMERKEIFVSVTEHSFIGFCPVFNSIVINKNALLLQDTAYIKRFVYIKCALKTE